MTEPYGAFNFAGVSYPLLTQPSGGGLLSVCDPSVAKLIDFIESVLTTYMGAALVDAAATVAPIDAVVKMTSSVDPSSISKVDQLDFPHLAVFRKRAEKTQKTANWDQNTWRIGVAYIFPPLSAAQAIQLMPALNSVGHIITNRLHYGFDPAYNSGERILENSGMASCKVDSSEIGRWDVSNELDYHGWFAELVMVEQEMETPNAGLQTLSGTAAKITDESVQPGDPVDVINAEV